MPILESSAKVEAMASVMVQLYDEVRKNFRATDYGHYIFTPRDMTKWTLAIMRHEFGTNGNGVQEAIGFEAERIFRDRLVDEDHLLKFDELLAYVMPSGINKQSDYVFVTNMTSIPSGKSVGIPLVLSLRKDYTTLLRNAINRYEFEVANFSHVLTDELCELCAKVDRVLTVPGSTTVNATHQSCYSKASFFLNFSEKFVKYLYFIIYHIFFRVTFNYIRIYQGAEDQKNSMQQLRAATEEENEKIEAQKKIIEEQLRDVEPMLRVRHLWICLLSLFIMGFILNSCRFFYFYRRNLSKAEKQIDKLSKGLLTVDEKVTELKAKFELLMKEATQIKIDLDKEKQRNAYLSLAEFASSLYFVFSDLHKRNHMYSFNVNTIIKLFNKVIRECKEWELFSGLLVSGPKEEQYTVKSIQWMDENRLPAVTKIQLTDQGTWSEFSRVVECENSLPTAIESKITPFQKELALIEPTRRSVLTAQSIFVLAWLHALLQERRTFIPQDFYNYVSKVIPSEDDPSFFGLPSNIRFSWQLTEAEDTIARMRISG
uniref:AAA domain-containing protein n=1 Tax=Heterorhabditis bacteriophora TaxID=37862 RepID=A0A1I7WK57_HETBA